MATILIVDDRPTNRELLITLLGYAGHRPLEASEGEQGLAIARAERPDLIVTDIVMPKMDGYEFARQVRADPSINNTQIIFYTSSYIVAETRKLAEACGVSIVIGKPIEPAAFLEQVRIALETKQTPIVPPVAENFHREHMRVLTDNLVNKVEELEAEIIERRQAEEKFRLAIEAAPDAIIMVDQHSRITLANSMTEKYFGYTREELMGKFVDELVPARFRGVHASHRGGFFSQPQVRPMGVRRDFFGLRKDGTEFPVEIGLAPIQLGDGMSVLATIVDITERKQAEQAVREAEIKYRTLVEQIPTITYIATLDEISRATYVSPQIRVLGFTPDEWITGLWVQQLHPDDRERVLAEVRRSQAAMQPFRSQYRLLSRDGEVRWYQDEAAIVRDAHGQPSFLQGVMFDITERKLSEDKIKRQVQQLSALHEIDLAISGSVDIRVALDVFLRHVISQLNVDAAAVLLFRPHLQTLEYAAGHGFRSTALRRARLKLGEGFAGRAVLDRRIVHIPDLMKSGGLLAHALLVADDEFVDYYGVPLMAKGEVKGVLELYHRTPLAPDPDWLEFLETLAGQGAIAIDNAQLFEGLQHSNADLSLAYDATIEGWSAALDLRDKETEGHSQRVTDMTVRLAQVMHIGDAEVVHIRRGALLHDIGKMGVPDGILLKPGPLTDLEWVQMKKHPVFAQNMLSPIHYLRSALDIPYCHHEKWDGTGYPRGLKGEQIPLSARIFAVVDVWDAVTSDRPYRPAWTKAKALKHIKEGSGKHFDPQVVEAFLKLIAEK